jgi:hypothetical protein
VDVGALLSPAPEFRWKFEGEQLAAALIAFSQALIASKYYQTILARLTVRSLPLTQAWFTEFAIRMMTLVALPTLLIAVLWRPELWAYSCALGALGVSVSNLLLLLLSTRLFRVGSNYFSGVAENQAVPAGFDQWWWSMLLYAGIIGAIAVGLSTGWMLDRDAYVTGLVVVTIGIHYFSKCVKAGFAVRGGLARSFAVGERLRRLEKTGVNVQW